MTIEHFSDLKTLFLQASSLQGEARAQFLTEVEERSAELAEQLKQLLIHDAPTDHQISHAVNALASDMEAKSSSARIGQSLGPYQLIRQIGQGGMGAVYLAERCDGEFEHQVAIKLIGTHAFSPDMIERFRNERQILARLNHPNIAGITDGGTTDSGITYLVMELVSGLSVTEYCDVHELTIKQRLHLFLQICDAIDFAHRNLVIHRDIKPSNILVTEDGTPKLLDFGIAKLLTSETKIENDAPATVIAITPDYSSPEQILGQPVTTQCDVYSLGVLLFEMLTGTRPFDRHGKRLSEIESDILHTTPQKPSQALVRSQQNTTHRTVTARALSGDLDTIVIAALRRDPKVRYKSVSALACDVNNYLSGQPVEAKGRSFGYVARKYLQRNRWPVGLAAVVLVATGSAIFFHIDRIGEERDRVFREAEKSAAVTKYLQSLFEIAGPNETQGKDISAQDVLDRGTRRLDAELVDQPDVRARLLTSIGAVYDNLGFGEKAIGATEKAIEIQRGLEESPQILKSFASLAQIQRIRGDFDATRKTLDEATLYSTRGAGQNNEEYALVLFEYAELDLIEGNFDPALDYLTRTQYLLDSLSSHDPEFTISVLATFGQVYHIKGDEVNAEAYMRDAISALDRLDYDIPVERATITHNLAALLHELGRYSEAETLYLQAFEIERRVLGDDHDARDVVITNLGRLYRDMGQFESAQHYLQMAVDLVRKIHGDEHFFTAYNSKNLADLLRDKQEYSEADQLYQQVVQTYLNTLEEDHPYMASARLGQAKLYVMTQEYEKTVEAAREALRICAKGLPADHWLTATTKSTLAEGLIHLGSFEESEVLLNEAWDALGATRGEHPTTMKVAIQLAEFYAATENLERNEYFTQQARKLETQ